MTDYGHDIQFGTFITPNAAKPDRVVALAEFSDTLGFDLVTFQDHPYQPALLDAWSLLAFVAGRTTRARLSANVTNLPLRLPVVLARASTTLDLLSGGRFELGLGAGGFWDAIEAVGGRRLTPGESVQALEEAIRVIRALWSVDEPGGARVDGEFYSVRGAKRGPATPHPIGISIGAYGPRMLRLTGRVADGWVPSFGYLKSIHALADMNSRIDEGAREAGRAPEAIRRMLNIDAESATVERLVHLATEHGMGTFILATDEPATLERFAAEVMPAVRAEVARVRG
ncbi:MAG TPA: LLM class flavin-dependent oxidoreductase [Terrimesophilobacter sp.]|nr:LLM class flavin-dependent oxidoreductase [Terrimesophilobacter sp.]